MESLPTQIERDVGLLMIDQEIDAAKGKEESIRSKCAPVMILPMSYTDCWDSISQAIKYKES